MSNVRSPIVPPCAEVSQDDNLTHDAFRRVTARALALPESKKLHIATDIAAAIVRSRTALPGLLGYRDAMLTLPGLDIAVLDNFDDTSRAMLAVDVQRKSDDDAKKLELESLTIEGEKIRSIAIADALPLVARGVVSPSEVESLKDGQGRDDLSRDLLRLASIFQEVLDKGEVPTAVTKAEVAYMRNRAEAIRSAVETADANKKRREHADLRARIYTLFVNDWSQIRRAITYLRWNDGDADTLAPSLFLKGKRGSSSPSEPDDNNSSEQGRGESGERNPSNNEPVERPNPAPAPSPFVDGAHRVPQDDPFAARS
jgi:hypothetical protein